MKAVLPAAMPCLILGGVTPEKMDSYFAVEASGFGIGSAVFKAGDGAKAVTVKAKAFKAALEKTNSKKDRK